METLGNVILLMLFAVLVAAAWITGRYTAPQPKSAPLVLPTPLLVFGLVQVSAAKVWARAHSHGDSVVKAAVVWTTDVLGYKNTVREETAAEVSAIDGANSERQSGIDQRGEEVAVLKNQITYLERQIRDANEQKAELQDDAERYGA